MFCSLFVRQPAEQAVTGEISTCCSINKQEGSRSLQEEQMFRKDYWKDFQLTQLAKVLLKFGMF